MEEDDDGIIEEEDDDDGESSSSNVTAVVLMVGGAAIANPSAASRSINAPSSVGNSVGLLSAVLCVGKH